MAYVQASALITRILECLTGGYGVSRTIAAGTYLGDFPQGLSEMEQMRRALVAPRVRATFDVLGRSKFSPPINGSIILYDITVTITSLRVITRTDQVDADLNDAIKALATQDADAIRQVLEYPNNLLTTSAGAPTNLVSGMLTWATTSTNIIRDINPGAQKLESVHTFTGILKDYPVSPPYNTVAPVISGTVAFGNTLTVTSNGTWSGSPTLTYTYQWTRNEEPIVGETNSTYVVTGSDLGPEIQCLVTATNSYGSADAYSNFLFGYGSGSPT